MAGEREHIIPKNFQGFTGRDLRSSDFTRPLNAAIEFRNAVITKNSNCTNRRGGKIVAKDQGFANIHQYSYLDIEDRTLEELLGINDNLYRSIERYIHIDYRGDAELCQCTFLLDPTTGRYYFKLYEDGNLSVDIDCGTGHDEVTTTIGEVQAQVNASLSFTATISIGDGDMPAAFLPLTPELDFVPPLIIDPPDPEQDLTITLNTIMFFFDWELVPSVLENVFSTSWNTRGQATYSPPSFQDMQNDCVYIATGSEYLHKYDGQRVYRAGVKRGGFSVEPETGLGGLEEDKTYRYIMTFRHIDNRGNIIEGTPAAEVEITPGSGEGYSSITAHQIPDSDGYNTASAIADVTGTAYNGNVIPVLTGHNIVVGDTIYFLSYDGVTIPIVLTPVLRKVTAITDTSITIDGAPIDIIDGTVISAGLMWTIWRTTGNGNTYYQLFEYRPNDPNGLLEVLELDDTTDAVLLTHAEYIPNTVDPDSLDLKPRFLTTHQGLLVAAVGNLICYSDSLSPEYFPDETYRFPVFGIGAMTGIGSDQEFLVIGKERQLILISGDLLQNTFTIENIDKENVGIASHHSIQGIKENPDLGIPGGLMFLSYNGFKMLRQGRIVDIGAPINKVFTDFVFNEEERPQLRRAISFNFVSLERYYCFVPCESESNFKKHANDFSITHIFDYFHNTWSEFTNINAGSGIALYRDEMFWCSKILLPEAEANTGNLYKQHHTLTQYDYADHSTPIPFLFGSQWDDLGDSENEKIFLRLNVYDLLRDLFVTPFELTVSTERNYLENVSHSRFTLSFGRTGGLQWGYFLWGVGAWGMPGEVKAETKLRSGKAKAMRFVFQNENFHEKVAITGWSYEVAVPYGTRMSK